MGENLLINGDFERGWDGTSHTVLVIPTDGEPYYRDAGEIACPDGWTAWYLHGLPIEHDPENQVGWAAPEIRPAGLQPDPNRVRSGEYGCLVFTFYRIHDAGMFQRIYVGKGKRVRLTGFAHAWSSQDDNPRTSEGASGPFCAEEGAAGLNDDLRNFTFYLGIDPTGGTNPFADTVVWGKGAHIYNAYHEVPAVEVVAEADTITVFLRSRTLWPFKHNDAYWDDVALEVIGGGGECRGKPREQYHRTYVLLPQSYGLEWAACAAIGGWENRYTVGYSADDAGIGDLDYRRVIAINPAEWGGDLRAWYEQYYPDVLYEALEASAPQELGILLLPDLDGDIALSQNDPRWADRPLGEDGGKIGQYGCLLTSFAMMLRKVYGKAVTPPVLADLLLIARIPFVGDALANWADAVALFPAFDRMMKTNGSFTAQELRALKDGGWEVVLASKAIDHFVYLEGITDGGTLSIIDPLDGKRKVWSADSVGGIRAAHIARQEPPPAFPSGCKSHIGLHLLGPTEGAQEFVARAVPSVVKTVLGAGQLARVHRTSPATRLVYRHWVPDQDRFLLAPDKLRAAREWLGLFLPTLQGMLQRGEVNEVWVESLNETYSHNIARNQHAIDFDLAFIEAVAETGLPLRPVVFTAAPGNPHLPYRDAGWEEQWRRILPLARRVQEVSGAFGYHAYIPVNPVWWPQWFETMAPYVHMRWAEFDRWLVEQGVYVYWMLGEVGAVYAEATPDGGLGPMHSGRGWRSIFDWPTYRDTLLLPFERMLRQWNEENGGRLLGAVVFQSGSADPAWDSFAWEGEYLLDFAERV